MASDDWPDWLPADWTVQINKVDQRKVKCYVDSQGYKCYSMPQVFEYLRKMGRSVPSENNVNGDGSTVDLSMGENAPDTNEMPESSAGGPLAKLTPRTSRRKSKPTGGSSYGDVNPPEPLSSERHHDSNWLPDGWTVEVRTRQSGSSSGMRFKCYTDPISGQKFFSRPQVLNHLAKTNRSADVQKVGTDPISPTLISTWENDETLAGDGSPSEPLSSQGEDGNPSWLPEGWTVEVKYRKCGNSGETKYKLYIDPVSGQKFFSKPQVLNHLAKINGSAGGEKEGPSEPIIANPISSWRDNSTEVNNSGKKTESARFSSDYEVVSRTPVEGLPPGWIKEMRLRKRGVARKTDPYYLDPLSELVFFSKKDALRYLESGNVKSCVMKPLRRDMSKDSLNVDMPLAGGETYVPPNPSKETEASKELPNNPVTESNTNGSVSELNTNGSGLNTNGSGIENPKPIRSITGGDFSTPNTRKGGRSISGGTFSSPKEDYSEWLPDGWTVEVHYKASGQKYKIYKETATGKKLYSKPQVLNYLDGSSSNSKKRIGYNSAGTPNSSQSVTPVDGSRPKRSIKKKGNSEKNADYEEVITTCPADGLPPGWIKELRTKIYATHKRSDPYYLDPVTGYIFRSKLDALRFLDTGDINLCAIRPKVKDKDGNEVSVYTSVVQKPADTTNGKPLVEGGENYVEKQQNDGDPKTAATSPQGTRVSDRIAKRNDSPTSVAARSSKRQKGVNPGTEENVTVEEKQGSGVNLEKQPDDDGHLSYDIPDDDNWTDHCIDFAVKTLTNEILFNGQPASSAGTAFPEEGAAANAGVDPTAANETPTKVN